MAERFSLHRLAAGVVPSAYIARYLKNLTADLNTLFFPGESRARSLEHLHVPLGFREMAAGETTTAAADSTKALSVWDILLRSPKLAIIGEPGAGKTTTLKYVAVTLAQRTMPESYIRRLTFVHQGQAFDDLLPIYADLSQLGSYTDDLAVFLAAALSDHGFPGAREFLRAKLKEGRCLLLLDRFDALHRPEHRTHLKELLSAYPKAQAAIAARTVDLVNPFPSFVCFEPLPLSEDGVMALIDGRLGKDSPAAIALLQALERDTGLGSVAGNPLLLSTLAWVSESVQTRPLPLRDLYERCLQVLFDDTTEVAVAPIRPTLDRESKDKALQELGRYFHERRQEQFDQEGLKIAVEEVLKLGGDLSQGQSLLALIEDSQLLRQQNNKQYAFLRLALQEFLTARAIVATDRLTEIVNRYVDDSWWHEVIVLATAVLGNATGVVQQILSLSSKPTEALLLAARCAVEVPATAQDIRKSLRDELFRVFQTGDRAHWQAAALCIAALESKRVSDYFPKVLKEGPVDEAERAALVMGRIGAPKWAMEPLLGALGRNRPWQVRCQAAWALGQLGDRKAVPTLIAAFKDEREEVASAAALALSAIGEPAVPSLLASLSNDYPIVRQMAVKALGKMGTLALRPLLDIVQDEKQPDNVVGGAAQALGLLRDPQAIPYLVSLLRAREGRLVEHAARALADIGAPTAQALIDSLPTRSAELKLSIAIVNALVAIGEPAIDALIRSLSSPHTPVRNAAAEALERIGAPAIEALVGALRSEKADLRRRAAEILVGTGGKWPAGPLMATLMAALNDEHPVVRARVVQVFGQIGQEQAVEPLVDLLQNDPDEFVRRTAVRTLADLRSERAIGPLIQTLDDAQLRDMSTAALSEIGEAAVEPLVVAINRNRNPAVQQACVKALAAVGVRSRVEEPTLGAVARVYSWLLLTKELSLDEMIIALEHIRWWKYGEELHKAFVSARTLAQAQSLREVAECTEGLLWVSKLDSPFRPTIKKVLWDLNSVAQNIQLYLRDPRREGQRDALLSAINTMTEIQETINTQLLEFEKRPFIAIVERWHQLTEEALKGLRGRAQLQIELLVDDLALHSPESAGKIVFGLTNVGDSAARNLGATLRQTGGAFEVLGDATQRLEPLGSGMQRNIEFLIKPLGVKEATVAFEVSYDDDEGPDRRVPFSGRVRFWALEEKYRPIPISPYVMGPPVKTPRMFFGRQDVFDWIRENISGTYQENFLVLHGERRMGKTSILYQLLNHPPTAQHICVFFSLELATTRSLGDLLYDMGIEIYGELAKLSLGLAEPVEEEFLSNAQRSFRRFWDSVERALGDRRLLIMIDEIDILIDKVERGVLSTDVFNFMRGLMQHSQKIAFIFTGAFKLREMLKDSKSILFNIALPYKISYLNRNEGLALIMEPVAEHLFYHDLVQKKILDVSGCHPYFIQYICDSLVKLAQRKQKNFVDLPDLDLVLSDVIQDNAAVLQNAVYAPLSEAEQKVLAALANVTDDYRILVPPDVVAKMLDKYKLSLAKEDLLGALRSLRERDLVDEQRVGQSLQYGFRMGLIRMWLRQNEVLLRLSQEMKI